MNSDPAYVGRFAPSPTGPLHFGSLVTAVASYLDARAHDGKWLIRIEDIDEVRTVPGATTAILDTLAQFGMRSDGEVLIQSQRKPVYEDALKTLDRHVYPCGCSRKEIADSLTSAGALQAAVYPGTCRKGIAPGKRARAFRLRIPDAAECQKMIRFNDRWQGEIEHDLALQTGDFVLKRADGFWAYQLAVVVDDHAQGITDVVRGADLLDSTARQIYLQSLFGYATPSYLHIPVALDAEGKKLSKQNGALATVSADPLPVLLQAASFLELPVIDAPSLDVFWRTATSAWAELLGERKSAGGIRYGKQVTAPRH